MDLNKDELLKCLNEEKRICEGYVSNALGYRGPNPEAYVREQEGKVSGKLDIIEDLIYWIERGDFDL